MSAFHRIDDAGEMEAAVFFRMTLRLPAYSGVLAARAAAEDNGGSSGGRAAYDSGSGRAQRASTADHAAPATAGALAGLNAQMGSGWFSHKAVPVG